MGGEGPSVQSRTPHPEVGFSSEVVARLERFAVRLSSLGERKEGAGASSLLGAGEEFIGYRPYRPGEDLRGLAWDLLARLDRPYVRVTRREASERWAILIDTSASMAVGPPGKLQAAAEIAAALSCVGLRAGAGVQLLSSDGRTPFHARRRNDLPGVLHFLSGLSAGGQRGLDQLLSSQPQFSDCGRVVLVGDFVDLNPDIAARLRKGRTELLCAQVLAPIELSPPRGATVDWLDPEGVGSASVYLGRNALSGYERALQSRLGAWRTMAARHGFTHRVHSSATAFEDTVRALLEG